MKISKNVADMSAVELNKNKCGYMNIHMILQTPEELTVPCDNQGTKSEDDTASLESKDTSIDLEEQNVFINLEEWDAPKDLEEQEVLMDIDEQNDLEEQNKSVEYDVGGKDDLHSKESMEDYYSRMLKQEKCLDRTVKLHSRLTPF